MRRAYCPAVVYPAMVLCDSRKSSLCKYKGKEEYVNRKDRFLLLPILCFLLALPIGCATAKYGKADVTATQITAPGGIVGQEKASVVRILGEPNFVAVDKNIDYWGYRNQNGWYIYLYYVSFGKTEAKDLIVEFSGGKANSAYLIDKGSSVGIFTSPLAVGN